MSTIRFVHLSDIHFGQERNGTLVEHNDAREELLKDCQRLRERIGANADGVLITGDIAFSGKKTDYAKAGAWLDRLTASVGCKRTSVMVIPGNHDVDLDAIDYNAQLLHEKLRQSSSAAIQAHLEGLAHGRTDDHPLHAKLRAYQEFAAQYGCAFKSAFEPYWEKSFPLGSGHILKLIGMTSVQVSDKLDAKGQMVLGNSQFALPRNDNVECVVLLHHPTEWFRDRSEAETYLHSRARVLMFGHEHQLSLSKHVDGNNYELLILDAGAVNPPDPAGDYRYTYNWIEFSVVQEDAMCRLRVTLHPRVWVERRTAFQADDSRMALEASEAKQVLVTCTQLRVPETVIEEQTIRVDPEVAASQEGSPEMAQGEDERFARLRFYFWRYLDWRQRLSVLVQVDVLPETTDQPLPQSLERLALDRARALGRLKPLWDAVMAIAPENVREPNPFT